MRFTSGLGLATICAVAFALPTRAHHSHGGYAEAYTDLQGVVKEVHLVVPHSWIYLEVKDPKGGEPQVWALEATGRGALQKVGITAGTLKIGDTIKVRCNVLRDGSPGCLLGFVKGPDGIVKDWEGASGAFPTDF